VLLLVTEKKQGMAESTAAALSSAAAAAPPKLIQQPSISLKQAPVCFGDSVVLFENDVRADLQT